MQASCITAREGVRKGQDMAQAPRRTGRKKRKSSGSRGTAGTLSVVPNASRPVKAAPHGEQPVAPDTGNTPNSTARDRIIDELQSNPTKSYAFKDLIAIAGISPKTVSSIMTQLRDSPKYGIVFQPERGFWQFRERRSTTIGTISSVEYFGNRYALEHLQSIIQRMRDNPGLFSPFDINGLTNLINVAFDPELVRAVCGDDSAAPSQTSRQ